MLLNALKKLPVLALTLFASTLMFAQQATLKGTIIDKNTQEPLYPATIKVGTTGTITNFDGKFELRLSPGNKKLEISYVGYETIIREITLKTGEILDLGFSLAEEINLLQTATVTSGKYEKPLSEVTVSLEVLKSSLIENTNAITISNALEKIPGVNIIGEQANIRGGSGFSYGAGSRVLLLVNDLPALQADAGTSNFGDIPVESIEQVEIVKGASSALYGSAALNGIFNVRTSYARAEPETKISIFGGIYDAPKDPTKKWYDDTKYESGVLFSHKQKINRLDLVLGGRYYKQKDVREHSDNEQGRFSVGLRYRIMDRLSVGVNSTYNHQRNQSYFYWLNAQEGNYRADPTTLSKTNPIRFYIDPFISYYDKGGHRHKFTGRFFSIDNNSETGTENASDNFYGEYQFQKKFEKIGLVLTTGLVGARSKVTAPLYGNNSYKLSNAAGYLQVEKTLFERLNFEAGLRYEYNKIKIVNTTATDEPKNDGEVIRRFGLNYKAGGTTFIRGSWGQGYRFPTIAETYITTDLGGTPISPNPDLQPEKGWSSEVGIKQGFEISNWNGFIDLASFWMEYEDMIEFIYAGFFEGFQAHNIGNTVIKGLDLSVQGQGRIWGMPTTVLAGYTYINPKFKEFTENDKLRSSADYNVLKYRFKHTVKIDIESKFNQLNIGLAMLRNSHMEAIDAIFETIVVPGLRDYRTVNNNGYYLFNARLGYQFNDHLKTSFLIKNLLNREYTVRPGLLEPTRLWSMRIDYRF